MAAKIGETQRSPGAMGSHGKDDKWYCGMVNKVIGTPLKFPAWCIKQYTQLLTLSDMWIIIVPKSDISGIWYL